MTPTRAPVGARDIARTPAWLDLKDAVLHLRERQGPDGSVPDPEVIRVAVPETFPAKESDVAGFTTSIAPTVPEVENPRFVVAVTPV